MEANISSEFRLLNPLMTRMAVALFRSSLDSPLSPFFFVTSDVSLSESADPSPASVQEMKNIQAAITRNCFMLNCFGHERYTLQISYDTDVVSRIKCVTEEEKMFTF